jgi:hypothetical protein
VTLVVADLIQSKGELEPNLFSSTDPAGSTTARVTVWLAEAVTKTAGVALADRDAATAAWVYFRAYTSKYRSLLAQPISEDVGEATRTYLITQIKAFEELALAALAQYEALSVVEDTPPPPPPPSTVSVPKQIVW